MGHLDAPVLASAGLWAAFLLGLVGGFGHCLAMCGPFVAAASFAEGCGVAASGAPARGRRSLGFQVSYHSGRLATYALIGALLGLLGGAGALATLGGPFSPEGLTRWLKLAAGVLMVGTGVMMLAAALGVSAAKVPEPTRLLTAARWYERATAELLRRGPRWGFALGMLMGLLPCAPLLPAELAALATGDPMTGLLTMLAFGLGTLPAMAGFGAVSGLIGARARERFAVAAGALVIALGSVVVWQGALTALAA